MTVPQEKTTDEAATSTAANQIPGNESAPKRIKHIVVNVREDKTIEALCGHTWPKGRGVTRDSKINHYPICPACQEAKLLDAELVSLELTARAFDYLAGIYRK